MTKEQREQFQKTLEIAQRRRNELVSLRSAIETELAQQSRAIAALAELLGEPTDKDIGLTGATLLIVRTANRPLAPTEIRDELKRIGYDMEGFSNPMASLHQILKRLEDKAEIEEAPSTDGKKRYRARDTSGDFVRLMYPSPEEIARVLDLTKASVTVPKEMIDHLLEVTAGVVRPITGGMVPTGTPAEKKK